MIADLLESISADSPLAPVLGLLAGVLLGLSPVALPAVPVVISALSPGRLDELDQRRTSLLRASPAVVAFVIGMDGVLALAGYLFVQVTVLLARGAVALNLVAAVLLAALGLRLLLRRASLCDQARRLPPRPSEALGAGLLFAVSGCPGCAPIAIGVGSAAALVGPPVLALLTVVAFVAGRACCLPPRRSGRGCSRRARTRCRGAGLIWSSAGCSWLPRPTTPTGCCPAASARCCRASPVAARCRDGRPAGQQQEAGPSPVSRA